MAIKSANWFMDSSYYDNYKDYEQIYEEYKDFFKKYGIDINSVRELGWNPMIFEVLKRHYDYNHNHPKQADLGVSKLVSKLVSPPSINSVLGGVLTAPKGDTPSVTPPMALPEQEKEILPVAVNSNGGMPALPIKGMYDESAVSTDMNEPSGKVVVGPDKEVKSIQPAQPMVKSLRRAPKPKLYVEPGVSINKPSVVNNTPAANVTPVQPPVTNTTPPVAAPTLSSVASQAIRHNGGFDDYRRQSVLSALRAAGGISPAEAVQRGIIPWEALNYV